MAAFGQGQEIIGDPEIGKDLYEQHCLNCHGKDGDGQGPDTEFLLVAPATFHSRRTRSKTDWEIMTTITFGVVYSPVHGWADRLSELERWDVLSYIRRMAPFIPLT